ncbi:glycine cleavage system aminomethyltransferase GcvT [Lysinibacillus sp. FSL M8-0216]|uniref:Aminomethyltransferase n=1 Tax=Lysinibacillus fusiformis TaxID=28031 RepID=A0A1H9IDL3_9BACI|nr:glycine cleavage system aminomethyltransferase GcvT [Lysinibacillus fusiformis]HAU35109.1 glycine cleavage system aminomethyltransferase GcvT [Lysinibacillus sp.]MCG7437262.1 glycine cleavage system aminomethyltransferase GcvT [Lysinibacillus fusiformis]SCY37883.1 aminomethyltransferase [Lysinibacillus fusiformis]SEN63574.1 aminomethyltransferase [Lysinibacillus fusiformis]SEQ72634.1 aminomethyltransferase [Lysinibacillus fusiformis]
MTNELKRTPLFEEYAKYGAKTVDFGGWELPVQFSSIKDEHDAVRNRAGLFDVSHMGEILVTGPDALDFLQNLLSNDVSKIATGQAQYTAMCYEDGGVVDDLLTYKLADDHYLLCVNAANIEKDYDWMLENQHQYDVTIDNQSEAYAQIALQGPLAEEVLQSLTSTDVSAIKFFRFQGNVEVAGHKVLVSRSGYTGEDGFELYGAPEDIKALWGKILDAGQDKGVVPAGLGCRDTLRFEAGLPLYGQELSATISPLEAGIGFAVKLNKEDFIGHDALVAQKENGLPRKLVGIEMIDKGIPRHGYKVFKDGQEIGEVTTGTQLPSSKRNVGHALIDSQFATIGNELEIEIRGKQLKVITVETPFYKRSK